MLRPGEIRHAVGGGCATHFNSTSPCCGVNTYLGDDAAPRYRCPAEYSWCVGYRPGVHFGSCAAIPPELELSGRAFSDKWRRLKFPEGPHPKPREGPRRPTVPSAERPHLVPKEPREGPRWPTFPTAERPHLVSPPKPREGPPRGPTTPSLKDPPVRMAWAHIPKCGTSFGNVLVHWANQSLPMRANIGTDERSFMRRFPYRQWFWDDGPIFWKSSEGNFGNHYGIDDASFTMFRGRFVGLFRNPALRAASAYAHFAEAIDAKGTLVSEREYAIRIRGSQTTQLAGQAFGLTCIWLNHNHDGRNHCRYHKPDIVKAMHRLITGFAFVGLTELYDLSVCLFHAMFGGRCLPVEFTNTRPTKRQAPEPTAAFTAWGGIVDGHDWRLYGEAVRIFFARLQEYGVNEAKCVALCPEAGDRFAAYRDLFRRRRL